MILPQALYFALPIYLANMAPVLLKGIPVLASPMDGGRTFRGQPLFGRSKTWRGFFGAILFGVVVASIQAWLYQSGHGIDLVLFNYQLNSAWILGALLGLGAITGDLVKSFFKRRLQKPSGSSWVPFDQLDFIIGGLLLGSLIYQPDWSIIVLLLILTPILHWLTNVIAYALGLKEVPW